MLIGTLLMVASIAVSVAAQVSWPILVVTAVVFGAAIYRSARSVRVGHMVLATAGAKRSHWFVLLFVLGAAVAIEFWPGL